MKILVYDDNPDFGGHQIMACLGVEALASDPLLEITFMLNPANRRLADRLATIENIQTLESPCTTRRLQGLRNRIDRRGIRTVEKHLQILKPDLVLCIQGDIEDASQGVIAVRRAGIKCVSYIAIPHRMAVMGAKLGALRDRVNQYLFNQPDRFITISDSMQALLIERGVKKPITIVPNGIPEPSGSIITTHGSRLTLGLLGRIEFNQKQQDFMVRAFCKNPVTFKECRLLIAGDGPDQEKLKALIIGNKNITIQPWQQDAEAFYAAIDFLVIPSRFEGLPLIMLEALARGVPVIGSARDGMKDMLPKAWTFETENSDALAETFSALRKNGAPEITRLQEKVLSENSLSAFKTAFCKAVTGN
ncbi:glycosyltransferase family 4 protein [Pontiella sulfatireligans]|uniref:Glycosyltransferase subfamily 4-like N-terminal domain-containing protein n=1 Tax=Pontiella sulfatireligans TaxID=2750658 RepID=A0A6C2ULQ0_9BACT|nr:glycosyltransferase family 4 protein [Pontiella sulfatireligans]VGO21038.1 hypothetical protein SCARR_03107 [Pontiella sulfatireligans]